MLTEIYIEALLVDEELASQLQQLLSKVLQAYLAGGALQSKGSE